MPGPRKSPKALCEASEMKPWTDQIDPATIPDAVILSERARRNSAKRVAPSGGRNGGRPRKLGARVPLAFREGDLVEAGKPDTEDYDTGKIISISGDTAFVGWASGVAVNIPLSELRPLK